ncbi:MAG: nucleotidyltransferase family protein [Ruminococcus sp.]|nr:nucleotidyltransferase family protein [Ruminococcus sp.]
MAVAIICEFNPFHNGHKYILETAKRLTNEPVIAIMSGSFTQRGEAAICSKFERARIALRNGADLVVELPAVYAVACAERFARGGVDIARSFGDVNFLAFGCESDDIDALMTAADAFDNSEVNALIAEQMKEGAYYPQAAERAVRSVCGDKAADAISSPNNILAVEYIRALKNSRITPLPIKRIGAAHDSDEESEGYASASKIREMLRGGEDASRYLPKLPHSMTYPENLERALLFKLRSMNVEDFRALSEVGEGLEHRIMNAVSKYNSIEEILREVKTKRYTHARLRRILCCAALGITEDLQSRRASYARVLGFTGEGEKLLKSCSFEVVTSVGKTLRACGENADFLRADILATDLAALAYNRVKSCGADYRTKIIR